MNIIIKTKNLKLTKILEKYINGKINSLERFLSKEENFLVSPVRLVKPLSNGVKARVEIEKTALHHKKGPFFRAECQMQIPAKSIRAESVSENLYLAIDEVKDELQREIKKYKNKSIAKEKRRARVFKKEIHLSPQARFYRKGRIKEEGI